MKLILKRTLLRYITEYEDYICVDSLGKLFRPEYVTDHFKLLLKNNELRHLEDNYKTESANVLANYLKVI